MSTATTRQHIEARARQVIGYGLCPIPLCASPDPKQCKVPAATDWPNRTFEPSDWQAGQGVGIRLGRQPDGSYLYALDLDSHHPGQNAGKFLNWIHYQTGPDLWQRFFEARSTHGRGRYILFRSLRAINNGTLHTHKGARAGEFLGQGRQLVYPTSDRWLQGSLGEIPMLSDAESDALLSAAGYRRGNTGVVTSSAAPDLDLDDNAVQHWYRNWRELEDERGVPRAIGNGISYKLLAGLAPITNASEARWTVIFQMYRVGYTDEEIIGYALRRCDWNRAGQKLFDDCTRLLELAPSEAQRRNLPPRRISDASQQRAAIFAGERTDQGGDKKSKRQRGRPRGGIAARLLAYLTQDGEHGTFDDTNGMLAAELHTTPRTIMRGLDALWKSGAIERRTVNGRRLIVLTPEKGVTKNSDAPPIAESAEIPQSHARERVIQLAAAAPIEATRVPPYPPLSPDEPADVQLADAYRAAIEAAAGEYGRVSKPRVREQFARYFPKKRWNDRVYARVMRQRRNETGATAEHFERLQAMKLSDLDKAIAGIERRIGRTHGLPPGEKPKGEKLTRKQLLARLRQLQQERSRKLAIATRGREQAPLPGVESAEAPPPDPAPSVEELGRMLRAANHIDPLAIAPDLIAFGDDTPTAERQRIGAALARLLESAQAPQRLDTLPIVQPWIARRNVVQQPAYRGGRP